MITTTADFGVAGMAHHEWSFRAVVSSPVRTAHAAGAAAAIPAQRKRRANAAPTIASVDRSFI
ncbi:putative udp-3-O-(3-hydroxymyristo yl)-glucosamine N-acyltransferase protein [uncultured Mycobacterium sp.]|uniref:Putative udp-3-O-(3-hydroxymyristo yl)-glucosamine N-acyltransferase protein n=1 Tax=uncultured Mycobacterium sp. TaxID=171292 RepID=A0A1Y5PDC4_9MYCO|nr:putative udp-3-O-(3-hydroxymyristo yl)-glucosamine N-acyltransferase protein [uncultured Mycobacterium sp.]